MKKNLIHSGLLIISLCFCMSAFSLTLGEAKTRGLVGEQANGKLGVIVSTQEVLAIVADINGRRHAAYKKIAQSNGTSITAIQKLAGKKAIAKTPAGQFIKAAGQWEKIK